MQKKQIENDGRSVFLTQREPSLRLLNAFALPVSHERLEGEMPDITKQGFNAIALNAHADQMQLRNLYSAARKNDLAVFFDCPWGQENVVTSLQEMRKRAFGVPDTESVLNLYMGDTKRFSAETWQETLQAVLPLCAGESGRMPQFIFKGSAGFGAVLKAFPTEMHGHVHHLVDPVWGGKPGHQERGPFQLLENMTQHSVSPFALQHHAWDRKNGTIMSQGEGPHDPVEGTNLSSFLWRHAGDRKMWITMRKLLIGAQYLPVMHHEFCYGDHRTHFYKPQSAAFDFEEYDGFDDARPFMRDFNRTKKELYRDKSTYVKTEVVFDWKQPDCLMTVHYPETGSPSLVLMDARDPYQKSERTPAEIAAWLYYDSKVRQAASPDPRVVFVLAPELGVDRAKPSDRFSGAGFYLNGQEIIAPPVTVEPAQIPKKQPFETFKIA